MHGERHRHMAPFALFVSPWARTSLQVDGGTIVTTFAEFPSGPSEDGVLVTRYLEGDNAALDVLVARYHQPVARLLARRVKDYALTQDLAQETWVRALQYLHSFDTTRDFGPWIKRIAANLVPGELGRRCAEVPTDVIDRFETALPDVAETVVEIDRVMACLAKLPSRQRRAITMRYLEDRDAQAIATSLGISRNAVEQLLLRARLRMRDEFGERYAGVPALAAVMARFRRHVDALLARLNVATGATLSAAGDIAIGAVVAVGGIGFVQSMLPTEAQAVEAPRAGAVAGTVEPMFANDPRDAARSSYRVLPQGSGASAAYAPLAATGSATTVAPVTAVDAAGSTEGGTTTQTHESTPGTEQPPRQSVGVAGPVPVQQPTVESTTNPGAVHEGGEVAEGRVSIDSPEAPVPTPDTGVPLPGSDGDIDVEFESSLGENPTCVGSIICLIP